MTAPRLIQDCPAMLLLLYTPGAGAVQRGYEPWLVEVDNPFFNAIPGVHHYANWAVESVLKGPAPGYSHFDFLGLGAEADLERVWFNTELDAFRTEWVRLWGYDVAKPGAAMGPEQANAYLMRRALAAAGAPTGWALVTGGTASSTAAAPATGLVWTAAETIRKHYAVGRAAVWRQPAAVLNTLGLDWVALRYGESAAALVASYVPGAETTAFVARLIAAP